MNRTWKLTQIMGLPLLAVAPLAGRSVFRVVLPAWIVLIALVWMIAAMVLAIGIVLHLAMLVNIPKEPQPRVKARDPPVRVTEVVERRDKCPVCCRKMRRSDVVMQCERCDLAQHQDCWAMIGRCARYGCGGKKGLYVTGRPA